MDIIQLQDVSKTYGNKVILREVNLAVRAGEFVVLCGESGAGKSTLLNLIGGLERPSGGRIIVDGKEISQMSARERTDFYRHEVGIIFQGSFLQPQFTLFENITLPGVFAGMPEDERKERAEQLAQMLGISENLKFLPKEVSGGQAERACIARALLLSPKIILADEPTSNLDEANAEIVLQILNLIRVQMGVTVIIASHSRDVIKYATQVVTVAGGTAQSNVTSGAGANAA
jgi:ABC-type lipoprotein export system ATPase subunit